MCLVDLFNFLSIKFLLWFSRCVVCSLCDNRAKTDRHLSSHKLITGLTKKKKVYSFTNTFSPHSVVFLQTLSDFPIADELLQSHVHTETWQLSTNQCLYYAGAPEPLYSRDQIRSGGTVSAEGHIRVMSS